jgi:hypothetical protein
VQRIAVSFAQGLNRFRDPGYFSADFALMKKTKVPGSESASLGIGFQSSTSSTTQIVLRLQKFSISHMFVP